MSRIVRTLTLMAALGVAAWFPSASFASGWQRWCGGCAPACETPCVVVEAKPKPQEFRECVVVSYKPKWDKKEVEVWESKMVEKPSTMKVMEVHTKMEPRTVIDCKPVYSDVPYEYYISVPKKMTKNVEQVYFDRKVTEYVENVPVCRTVRVKCVDECGRCSYRCETVNEVCAVRRCKVEFERKTRMVEVCYFECEKVLQKGMRRVCNIERTERKIEVPVNFCVWVEKPCKVWVCERNKVMRTVDVCTMERVETVVRVPVCETVSCSTGCGQRRCFGCR